MSLIREVAADRKEVKRVSDLFSGLGFLVFILEFGLGLVSWFHSIYSIQQRSAVNKCGKHVDTLPPSQILSFSSVIWRWYCLSLFYFNCWLSFHLTLRILVYSHNHFCRKSYKSPRYYRWSTRTISSEFKMKISSCLALVFIHVRLAMGFPGNLTTSNSTTGNSTIQVPWLISGMNVYKTLDSNRS